MLTYSAQASRGTYVPPYTRASEKLFEAPLDTGRIAPTVLHAYIVDVHSEVFENSNGRKTERFTVGFWFRNEQGEGRRREVSLFGCSEGNNDPSKELSDFTWFAHRVSEADINATQITEREGKDGMKYTTTWYPNATGFEIDILIGTTKSGVSSRGTTYFKHGLLFMDGEKRSASELEAGDEKYYGREYERKLKYLTDCHEKWQNSRPSQSAPQGASGGYGQNTGTPYGQLPTAALSQEEAKAKAYQDTLGNRGKNSDLNDEIPF